MIFNGVAMIFGKDDYWVALRIVALASFTAIMLKVAFSKDGLHNVRYMLALIFFINVALLPKTNVIITDKAVPANSAVVGNVPIGLAAISSVVSQFGFFLSKAVETATALPYSDTVICFVEPLIA